MTEESSKTPFEEPITRTDMNLFTLKYHISEAVKGFRYGAVMSMATITTVAISLTILGAFYLFFANINKLMTKLETHLVVTLYLQENIKPIEIEQLANTLDSDPRVKSFEVISREKAMEQLKADMGDSAGLLEDLDHNPLPDSIVIQLNPVKDFAQFRERYDSLPIVAESSSGQDWVEKLSRLISLSRSSGNLVLLLLGLANLVIIANTIQLTVFARREEIEIMRLVGATNWFTRMPFLIEGILQGVLGAISAIFLLTIGYTILQDRLSEFIPGFQMLTSKPELIHMHLRILFLGMLLGFLGSLLSLRKFLV